MISDAFRIIFSLVCDCFYYFFKSNFNKNLDGDQLKHSLSIRQYSQSQDKEDGRDAYGTQSNIKDGGFSKNN